MTTGTNGWTVIAVAIVVSTLLGCAGSNGTPPPTPVTVAESGGSTDVTEGGATDTYTVVLDSQPTADVMIAVSTDAEVSVATSSLTFTSVNWNVAQTVTVTAVDDAVVEGVVHAGSISHAATSTDPNYNVVSVAGVTANVTDNDVSGSGPTVALRAPVGWETWSGTKSVVWTTSDAIPSTVTIQVSSNSGGTWNPLVSGIADTGSYSWDTTTQSDGPNYRVQVTATDAAGNASAPAASPSDFTINNTASIVTANIDAGDWGHAIATDSNANVFIAGTTEGFLDGNAFYGKSDFFLIKYDSTGQRLWARQLGTTLWDNAHGVATDSGGNAYVAGTAGWGLDGNPAGLGGLFVVKYNSAGARQWTRQLGTSTSESVGGVATDSGDNVYVAGHTSGGLDGNTSAGGDDLYLVKYNSAGVKQWTRQLGSSGGDLASGVATDTADNIYVVGTTGGNLDGNISAGFEDLFVVKYDAAGNKQWTRQLGGTFDVDRAIGNDHALAVATDGGNNVYVVGETNTHLDGNTNPRELWTDIFVVKYDWAGNKLWTRQLGSVEHEQALGVATDSSSNVYVTGYTAGNLDGNTSSGVSDIFLVKYNSAGTKQWTRQYGTTGWDYGHGAATDTGGNIYIGGHTTGGLNGNSNYGKQDLFVMKLNASGTAQWTRQFGSSVEVATGAPASPTGLTATAPSSTQNDLTWTDNSSNEDGFKIESSRDFGATWTQIASVGPNVVTYSDTDAGAIDYFRVRAYNAAGNSAPSAQTSIPRIIFTSTGITEDAPNGATIGTLSGVGFSGPITFGDIGLVSKVSGPRFSVSGNNLNVWIGDYLDYKSHGEFRIILTATDGSPSNSIDVAETITVTETPYVKIDNSVGADMSGRPGIAAYGTGFFAVYRDIATGVYRACRITSTGQNLDPGGITLGSSASTAYGYHPAVAFDGTNFLAVWPESDGEIYGVRANTTGGVVDGTPIKITTGAATKIRPPSIAFDGTNYVIAWRNLSDEIKVARVSTSVVIQDTASGIKLGNGFYPWIATNGTNYLVIWHANGASNLDIMGNRFSLAGAALDGANGFVISSATGLEDHASVASNGTDYLVVWHLAISPDAAGNDRAVMGARVTGAGVVQDSPAFQITSQCTQGGGIGVAFDGTDYMVGWFLASGDSTQLGDVHAQKVSTGGVLLGSPITVTAARGHQWGTGVAYNSNKYFFAWNEVGPSRRDSGIWGDLIQK